MRRKRTNPGDDTVDGTGKGRDESAETRELVVEDRGGRGDGSEENASVLGEGLVETAVETSNVRRFPVGLVLARDQVAQDLHGQRCSFVKARAVLVNGIKHPLSKDVEDRVAIGCQQLGQLFFSLSFSFRSFFDGKKKKGE